MSGFPPNEELSPLAQALHFQWGAASAEDAVRMRRAEDDKAASILGARTVHFDFLDCVYRRAPNGGWLYMDVFVQPLEVETDLPSRIAETVSARLKPDDVLVCQLGIGSHVDHLLVRRACESLGRPLRYDADIPYLFKRPEELAPQTAQMEDELHLVSEAGLKSWQEACLAYVSQMPTLFESEHEMREKLRSYRAERGGIVLWRRKHDVGYLY